MPLHEFLHRFWDFTLRAGYFGPVMWVVLGLLLGVLGEKLGLRLLARLAARTPVKADDIIVHSLRGAPLIFGMLFGLLGATNALANEIPQRIVNFLLNTVTVLAILTCTVVVARICSALVARYASKGDHGLVLPTTSLFRNLTTLFVFTIGLLLILQALSINIAPLLTALGVGGLAVALALQDTLSNLFSGLYIIASRQIRVGDYISLSTGEEGYVADIRWRNTQIRNLSNNMIIVPNSKLASTNMTNYYQPEKELSVNVDVLVEYGEDFQRIERMVLEIARGVQAEVQGAVRTHEPSLRIGAITDAGVRFGVNLRGQEFTDQYLIRHEFLRRLNERFRMEGIRWPYPGRRLEVQGLPASDERRAA